MDHFVKEKDFPGPSLISKGFKSELSGNMVVCNVPLIVAVSFL